MNKIKTLMMAVVAFCAASITSCTDKMDWDVDPAYDRLFGILSCDVTPDATSMMLEYKVPKGADGYQIQWSTSEMSDDVEEAPGEMIAHADKATIEGLMGDTPYYIRLRAISDTKKCSKWVYVLKSDGTPYKTLKEQIMNAVSDEDRGQDAIRVTWDATKEVTHLVVTATGFEQKYDLDAEAKAAGAYTVTGLEPQTTYTFSIYYGESLRGTCSASTTAAAPKGDYTYYLPATQTVLDNVIMKEIADLAKEKAADPTNYSATIVVAAGANIDMVGTSESGEKASLKIPEGMSVTFFGAAGVTPTVTLSKSINLAGKHSFVRFENLCVKDGGCQYMFNQADECNVSELSFEACEFNGLERAVVRVQGGNAVTIGAISLNNCIIANIPDNYYTFDLRGSAQNISKFVMTNTTVYNVCRFFQNPNTQMNEVTVSDCTFNDIIANGRYFFDFKDMATNITIANSIIGTLKEGAKGIRTAGAGTYENVYQTNDILVPASEEKPAAKFSSNDMKIEIQDKSAADIFTDPANGNFSLKIGDRVGDPRWYMTAE